MHLTKVSALAVQIGFTTASVIGGAVPDEQDVMGRHDWREAKDAALQRAGEAQARASELAKQYRERDTVLLSSPIVSREELSQEEHEQSNEKRQFGFGNNWGGHGKDPKAKNNGNSWFPGWGGDNKKNDNKKQGGGFFSGGGSWEDQQKAGQKAAQDAKQRAKEIADAYKKMFGNGGGDQAQALQARQDPQAVANAAAAGQAAAANAAAVAAADPNAAAAANAAGAANAAAANAAAGAPMPANGPNNNNNGNWNQDPNYNDNGAYGAPAPVVPEPHETAMASAWMGVGGDHGNNGDWAATASDAVASANSVAASYRSEYSAGWTAPAPAPAAPTPTQGWEAPAHPEAPQYPEAPKYEAPAPAPAHPEGQGYAKPSGGAGWVGEGHQPSQNVPAKPTALVEVNGATGLVGERGRIVAGAVVGAGVAGLAVAFGML